MRPFVFLRNEKLLIERGYLYNGLALFGNSIGLGYYLKHSALLDYYKDFTKLKGDHGPIEPADNLKVMANEMSTKELKDMVSENTPISLYITPGLKTLHMGTVGTWSGGIVGIPIFYEFNNEQDVFDSIQVQSKYHAEADKVMEQEFGKVMKSDCFLLSEKAKKYGIAREILLINTYKAYLIALLPFTVCTLLLVVYNNVSCNLVIFKYPLYIRGLFYTSFIVFGLSLMRILYKNITHYYESEVEDRIAHLGIEYLEGGIECCSKELERNSLLVEMKNQKSRFLKIIDDFVCSLTIPRSIPLEKRIQFLKAHLAAANKTLIQ